MSTNKRAECGREKKWPSVAGLLDRLHWAPLAKHLTYPNFISFIHRVL